MLLHAFVISIAGTSPLAFRIFDWLAQMVTTILIFSLTKRLAGPRAGAISAIFYATIYIIGGYNHTASREGFIVPLLLMVGWSLWNYVSEPKVG